MFAPRRLLACKGDPAFSAVPAVSAVSAVRADFAVSAVCPDCCLCCTAAKLIQNIELLTQGTCNTAAIQQLASLHQHL